MHLLKSLFLPDFPSGSSINFYDDKLFLVGDDASSILILDSSYEKIGSVQLFEHPEKRIPKKEKTDFEASSFLSIDGMEHLLIMGSGSKRLRKKIYLIPFQERKLDLSQSSIIDTDIFVDRVLSSGVDEVNFEGVAFMGTSLVISNRGNRKNITNHLIITDERFWNNQSEVVMRVTPLQVPSFSSNVPGVSEIYYEVSLDLLLIALSSEDTDTAYNDGAIGNSYIGWIRNFGSKIMNSVFTIEGIVCLPDIHSDFAREKIEGLCIAQIEGNSMIIHLISDNDQGESKLFKVKMPIPS
ncbi:DUF6929 family protein [Ohtaekwangia koreensis]|uniref:Uncharacterized protein n=1 Tax=Ohtaekwangia koreensis TaxID=688867 RepID=A0A1T5KER7_9BACT|nr:hypothetical protein [Ohtaekwangia koreensis]SKC62232.1 hypothetical protein SAMN05660236_2106 [Ohtaekwangia koreensis]